MKSYRVSFKKISGELRNMHFAKLNDLPTEFVSKELKGSKSTKMNEDLEIVWDLDINDFRIVNWKTVEGVIKEEEVNFSF